MTFLCIYFLSFGQSLLEKQDSRGFAVRGCLDPRSVTRRPMPLRFNHKSYKQASDSSRVRVSVPFVTGRNSNNDLRKKKNKKNELAHSGGVRKRASAAGVPA